MHQIAKKFIEESKDAKNPNILIKILDTDNLHNPKVNDTYEQISEVSSIEEVVKISNPKTIYTEFGVENSTFESGGYVPDTSISILMNDSIQKLEKLGFQVTGCLIKSSTDGQGLSDRLKKDLKSKGYSGDNKDYQKLEMIN